MWRYIRSFYREYHFMKRADSPYFLPVGIMGAGYGCAQGVTKGMSMADRHQHGKIWRPVTGAALGTLTGLCIGLYWIESLCVLVCFDVYQSKRYIDRQERQPDT